MSFIKKDVNFGLLFIIIILAVAIASIGIYYNQNYGDLSKDYTGKLNALQKVTQDLMYHKSQLNQTAANLRIMEQDESELSKKYSELRDNNEKLDAQNKKLNIDVNQKTAELVDKTNQLLSLQSDVATQKTQIASLTAEVARLESKVSSLKDDLDDVCGGDNSICS